MFSSRAKGLNDGQVSPSVRPTATYSEVDTPVLVPEILRTSSLQKKRASSKCGFRENLP